MIFHVSLAHEFPILHLMLTFLGCIWRQIAHREKSAFSLKPLWVWLTLQLLIIFWGLQPIANIAARFCSGASDVCLCCSTWREVPGREVRSCGGAVPYFEARPRLHDFYLRFPFPPLNFIVLVLDVVFCRSIFSSGEPRPGLCRPRLRLQILSWILIQLDTWLQCRASRQPRSIDIT